MSSQVQSLLDTDTIAAIATSSGRGGIGVLRLSGPEAQPIAERLITLRNPLQPGRVRYSLLFDDTGQRIDDAIVTLFRAPHSYTGEDVVEIATHGSPVVLEWVLSAAVQAGARLARPGEFTERAFLRGRLDLTQAEAVRDLIEAQTLAQAHLAAEQMGGSLAREIRPIKQQLVHLIAALEAGIDFAEDDLQVMPDTEITHAIASMLPPLQTLLSSFAHGRLLREGLRLAIVGKPNAGKSSLFNRLLARERAIVTPVAGTTRDVVSERLLLDGIPIELLDTAGLRETADEVERIGVARSHEAIADADMVVLVVDAAAATGLSERSEPPASPAPLTPGSFAAEPHTEATTSPTLQPSKAVQFAAEIDAAVQGRPLLLVYNKIDLVRDRARLQATADHIATEPPVYASALTGEGVDALQSTILRIATGGAARNQGTAMLSNLRQHGSIACCLQALAQAENAAQTHTPHEMLLLDLYEALRALDELTGEVSNDDILTLIFSTFCIGK